MAYIFCLKLYVLCFRSMQNKILEYCSVVYICFFQFVIYWSILFNFFQKRTIEVFQCVFQDYDIHLISIDEFHYKHMIMNLDVDSIISTITRPNIPILCRFHNHFNIAKRYDMSKIIINGPP